MQHLNSYTDISTIPDNYSYTSPKKKARYFWTLFFGLLTGDLNPVHINPFTTTSYKSKLGGLARHGISTLAEAESFIFKIFKFKKPTEIIAKGYNKIRYVTPVTIGDEIRYTFILSKKKALEDKKCIECTWHVTGLNQNGKCVFTAEWIILYSAIEKNIIKRFVRPFGLLAPSIEIHDTPVRIFMLRVWITIVLSIMIDVYVYYSSN